MIKKLIGYCGVDSGTILIVDPCYVLPNKVGDVVTDKDYTYEKFLGDAGNNSFQHKEILAKGVAGTGIITSAGFGDGNYPVFAYYGKKSGRVRKVTIEFFRPQDDFTF